MKKVIDDEHPLSYFLKSAREDMDMKQVDVMKLTGINNKTLGGYENGTSEPDFNTLSVLAKLYNISLDEIIDIKETKHWQDFYRLTDNEKNVVSLFRKLPKDRQDELIVQLSALVKYLKCKD